MINYSTTISNNSDSEALEKIFSSACLYCKNNNLKTILFVIPMMSQFENFPFQHFFKDVAMSSLKRNKSVEIEGITFKLSCVQHLKSKREKAYDVFIGCYIDPDDIEKYHYIDTCSAVYLLPHSKMEAQKFQEEKNATIL